MATSLACPASSTAWGGEHALHPRSSETRDFVHKELGGTLDIHDVRARECPEIELPPFLAQIRLRSALSGYLHSAAYGIRADQVIRFGHGGTCVDDADAVRSRVSLTKDQKLILLLFVADDLLEGCWSHRRTLIPQIAAAGYDLVVPPSFSVSLPRPRPDHLVEIRRSFLFFDQLQRAGAVTIPRLGWAADFDPVRLASWADSNPNVRRVAIDTQTLRSQKDWHREYDLVNRFDQATQRSLTYLVNGPTTEDRINLVIHLLGERVTISNASSVGPPPAALPVLTDPRRRAGLAAALQEQTMLERCRTALITNQSR